MLHPLVLALAGLAGLPALPGRPAPIGTAPEPPRFAPAEGLALRKSFEWERPLALLEMTSTLGGVPVPEAFLPQLEIEIAATRTLVVEDRYAATADGRPRRLVRTYERVAEHRDERVELDGEDGGSRVVELATPLEGRRVAFERAGAGYRVEALDDVAAELPEDLAEDLDLRGLLPPAGADLEAGWELGEEALRALLAPGGELGLAPREGEPDAPFEEVSFGGEVTARLAGTLERDGRTLARVALDGTVERAEERPSSLEFVPVVDGAATETRTTRLELEGELLWDLAAGHAAGLTLEASARVHSRIEKDPGQEGPEFDAVTVLFGTWRLEARFEPAG